MATRVRDDAQRKDMSHRRLIIDVDHAKTVTNRMVRGVVIIQKTTDCIIYTICTYRFFPPYFYID